MNNEQLTMKTEWVHKKLGDNKVALIIMGQSPSSSTYNDDGIGLPFLQGCADFGEVFPKIKTYCSDSLKVAPANSILMSVRAPVGTINKADQKYVIGRGLCSIVPVIDGDFLYYYLLQNTHELELKAQGSTFLAINSLELNEMPISYPKSLSVQRRIAAILSSADKVIDSTRRLIEKYKKMKQGMMEELFNEQCTMNNVQWKKVRLGEMGDFYVGGDVDRSCFSPYPTVECRFPIYANALVNEGLYGYSNKYEFDKEAVTITGRGDVGKVFYRKPYFSTIIRLVTLIPTDSNIDVMFLSYAMSRINFIIESTGVPQLTAPQAKKYEVSIPYKNGNPDLAEQRRIAAILSGIDAKIAAEEKVLEKYTLVKKGLMEKLLNNN